MVYFSKSRKKVPYEVRIREMIQEVNKKGEISVNELVGKWLLDPYYIKRLISMALARYPYLGFDEENDILYIKEKEKKEEGEAKNE
jgi:hypothetical protein